MLRPGPSSPSIEEWWWKLAISLLFGVGAVGMGLLATPWIPGADDGYRHVRYAYRLATEGRAAMADPWRLKFYWPTAMDVWFGYHLLLAPLTLALPLITALKTMVGINYAALVYAQLELFEELGIAWKGWWISLALFGSGIVLYRGMYGRPFLLSLALVVAATLFTIRDRRWALFVVSAVHAFCYSIVFFVAVPVYLNLLVRRDRRSLKLALWCTAGMMLGVAANPYFPGTLAYYWASLRGPLVAGTALNLLTAGELDPLSIWWVVSSLPIALLVLAGFVRLVRRRAEFDATPWVLLLTIGAFFVVSLRVARAFDYIAPLGTVFAALTLSRWFAAHKKDAPYVAFLLALPCTFNLYSTWTRMVATTPATSLQGVATYLAHRGDTGLVFNSEWGEYFFLYFFHPRGQYLVGIEPSLMYLMDTRRYWLWRHISDDEASTCDQASCAGDAVREIAAVIVEEFRPAHVLVEFKKNPKLAAYLSGKFAEEFRDAGCVLFAVRK